MGSSARAARAASTQALTSSAVRTPSVGAAVVEHGQRHLAGHQRIGLAQMAAQSLAADHEHKTMLFHRLRQRLRSRAATSPVASCSLAASRIHSSVLMRPARRSVMMPSASALAKLPRAAMSFGPRSETDAQRLQHTTPDLIVHRIVAEEAEVGRAAARLDPRSDRRTEANRAFGRHLVQVGCIGGFKLGQAAGFHGQATQSIHDQEDDFAAILMQISA